MAPANCYQAKMEGQQIKSVKFQKETNRRELEISSTYVVIQFKIKSQVKHSNILISVHQLTLCNPDPILFTICIHSQVLSIVSGLREKRECHEARQDTVGRWTGTPSPNSQLPPACHWTGSGANARRSPTLTFLSVPSLLTGFLTNRPPSPREGLLECFCLPRGHDLPIHISSSVSASPIH